MFIEKFMNTGKPYLRLVKSKRVINKNGKSTPTKTVILNIGPLSRFDDGKPDYLARLKQSFKDGAPLIPALQPYADQQLAPKLSDRAARTASRIRRRRPASSSTACSRSSGSTSSALPSSTRRASPMTSRDSCASCFSDAS